MVADASSAAGAPVRASWRSDRDVVWLLALWIVLSIIGCLLVALVWGPHMPPGRASNTAANQDADSPHTVIKFSFMTPKTPGTYRWQCFVPCGGGYLDGNGGPMGTPGYMMGQMEVQA